LRGWTPQPSRIELGTTGAIHFAHSARTKSWENFIRAQVGAGLDGYIAPELRVASAVHLAHSARTDSGEDFVRAETAARERRHEHQPAWNLSPRKTRCTYTMGTVARILHQKHSLYIKIA